MGLLSVDIYGLGIQGEAVKSWNMSLLSVDIYGLGIEGFRNMHNKTETDFYQLSASQQSELDIGYFLQHATSAEFGTS